VISGRCVILILEVNMKETVEAIYENGVLRLLKKLSVPEGRRMRVTLESSKDDESVDSSADQRARYDFSDLVGKLTWRGDALNEQRRIRDEWT
jgi:predicted DNA-binding antitoxin AbrB/MazE fold protein